MPSQASPRTSSKSVLSGGLKKVKTSEPFLCSLAYSSCSLTADIPSSFAFAYDEEVEPGLVAFIRLLVFDFEWSRAQKKGKLPTTMLDKKVGEVLEKIISDREAGYGQSIQVSTPTTLSEAIGPS